LAVATGAAIAGATAAASIAYLDGRYHLFKDIGNIREERRVAKLGQELGRWTGNVIQTHG
jgi:hypothetical protein